MSLLDHPKPWRIRDTGNCFIVSDGSGKGLAWFYYRREPALRNEYQTLERARELAQAFARLSLAIDS